MNPFLEACGAFAPFQITVEPPGASAPEVHAFDLPFVLIGRDPRCDLRLDHPEVSDRHAYVQWVEGRPLVIDLGSVGGTTQGGKRLRRGWFATDPATRVGPFRLRLIAGAEADRARDEAAPPVESYLAVADPEPGATPPEPHALALDLVHRSFRRTHCAVKGQLALVGSGTECAVRFLDPGVSSLHAALVLTPAGVWVVDLLGQGGVRVNGREVNHARLFPGDEVRLNTSTFRVASLPLPPRDFNRLGAARMTRPPAPAPPPPQAPTAQSPDPPAPAVASAVPVAVTPTTQVDFPAVDLRRLLDEAVADLRRDMALGLEQHREELRRDMALGFEQLRDEVRRLADDLRATREPPPRRPRTTTQGPPREREGQAAPEAAPAAVPAQARPPLPVRVLLPRAREADAARPHDEGVHALLSGRIIELQSEQRGLWKRLVGLLNGGKGQSPSA